jgi:hypothetical protein
MGMCPIKSCLVNIWLNRVQNLGFHESLDVDTDELNKKFLENYKIVYKYKKPVNDWGTIPDNYFLIKEKLKD